MMKAIVFDFDGVIVDSEPLHFRAFLQMCEPLGLTFDYQQYLEQYVGYDDRDFFRIVLRDELRDPNRAADDDAVAQLCRQKQAIFDEIVHEGVNAIPGAVELVDQARAALPIAIASGATQRDINLILEGMQLTDRFEIIISADDVARSKPDPETYLLAVQALATRHPELDLQPEQCLAIEDTPTGLAAARAAGLQTLGLASTGPIDALQHAHRAVESLENIDLDTLQLWFG